MLDVVLSTFIHSSINCDFFASSKITEETITRNELVKQDICQKLAFDFKRVKLTPLKITTREVKVNATIEKSNDVVIDSPLAGRVKVGWNEIDQDGTIVRISVLFSIEAYKSVAVFNKNLPSNTILKEHDISYKEIDVGPYLGLKEPVQDDFLGKMLVKRALKGGYVFSEYLSSIPLVKQNEEIIVSITSGGLIIRATATVLENGFSIGDRIKVRIKHTGMIVPARIKGEKAADVEI